MSRTVIFYEDTISQYKFHKNTKAIDTDYSVSFPISEGILISSVSVNTESSSASSNNCRVEDSSNARNITK